MFLPPFWDLTGNDLFKNHKNFFCGVRESSLTSLLLFSLLKQIWEGTSSLRKPKISTAGYIISEWRKRYFPFDLNWKQSRVKVMRFISCFFPVFSLIQFWKYFHHMLLYSVGSDYNNKLGVIFFGHVA